MHIVTKWSPINQVKSDWAQNTTSWWQNSGKRLPQSGPWVRTRTWFLGKSLGTVDKWWILSAIWSFHYLKLSNMPICWKSQILLVIKPPGVVKGVWFRSQETYVLILALLISSATLAKLQLMRDWIIGFLGSLQS